MAKDSATNTISQRRKRPAQDRDTSESRPIKKQRRKKAAPEEIIDLDQGINTAIGKMDNYLLADFVAQSTRRFGKHLSLVELEDDRISGCVVLYVPHQSCTESF